MTLTIPLSPDLAARLSAEAARAGVPLEQVAVGVLGQHLPPADRRAAAIAMLESWINEGDPAEQCETLEALVNGLDAARPGQRPHFPPELKGVTW